MSVVAAAGADPPLGDRGGVRVVLDRHRQAEALAHPSRSGASTSGMLTEPIATPARWSIRDGTPKPTAATRSSSSSRRPPRAPSSSASSDSSGVGRSRCRSTVAVARRRHRRGSSSRRRRRRSHASAMHGGYPNPPHGRLGREAVPRLPRRPDKGKVPLGGRGATRASARAVRSDGAAVPAGSSSGGDGSGSAGRRRWTLVAILGAVRPVRGLGRRRLPLALERRRATRTSACRRTCARGARRTRSGLLFSSPTTILLLGTDHATGSAAGRSADQHSDSIMLVHTDPSRHRIVYLSIPRDLRVADPGLGDDEDQRGDAGRRAEARDPDGARADTALPINHVIVVDFASFKDLIDALGGITVNVPERSSRTGSTARTPRRSAASSGRAGGSHKGPHAHERPPGAHLLAHPREPARPARGRTSTAHRASRP